MSNDNVVLPGNDRTVATDEIWGVHHQLIKVEFGDADSATQVSASNPLPVTMAGVPLPSGAATETTLASILAKIIAAPATEATLASVLAKIIGAPATEAKQDSAITQETAINTVLGLKGDAKSASTDTTAITAMSVWKQISASVQAIATSIAGTLTATLAAGTNTIGKTYIAYQTTKALTNASVSASSSGENTLVSGTAAQTIRVFKIVLVAAAAVNVSFKDAASGTSLTGAMPLLANGALVLESNDGEPLFVTATAGAFILNLSGAVSVTGFIQYVKS